MYLRKFYEVDAADTTAAAPAEEVQPTETPTIASMMAKGGVVNLNPGNEVEAPIDNTEKTEEPEKKAEATPDVPSKEQKADEQVKTESPATKQDEKKETQPIADAPKAVEKTWQEVLKSQPDAVVLKELGYDDKIVGLLNHWKANGNLKDYMRELSTDYAKMPPEEVMRHQLRREYPKATEAGLDVLYRKEVINAYNLNSDDEDEVAEGKLLLETKAERFRDELVANQEKFLLPTPPESKPTAPDPKALELQEVNKRNNDLYVSAISNNAQTKDIFANKKITLGEGDSKFTFPVEPQEVLDTLLDMREFQKTMFDITQDEKGYDVLTPKIDHQLLVATVAKYGKAFLDEYAKHYEAVGGNKTVAPLVNASKPDKVNATKSETKGQSPAALMARQGQLVG